MTLLDHHHDRRPVRLLGLVAVLLIVSMVGTGCAHDDRDDEVRALERTCASIIERVLANRAGEEGADGKEPPSALLDPDRLDHDPQSYYRELQDAIAEQQFGEQAGGSSEFVPNVVAFRRTCGAVLGRDTPAFAPGG